MSHSRCRVVAIVVGVALVALTSGVAGTAPDPSAPRASTDPSAGRSGTPGAPPAPGEARPAPTAPTGPAILALLPNPVAAGDPGELAVLSLPAGTPLGAVTLSDGDRTVGLPRGTAPAGPLVVVLDGNSAAERTTGTSQTGSGAGIGGPVPPGVRPGPVASRVRANASLTLANGGTTVRLSVAGVRVDATTYRNAGEGEFWRATTAAGGDAPSPDQRGGAAVADRWVPRGTTALPVVDAADVPVRTFALPDAPGPPVEALRGADRRILLAGYTFSSRRIAGLLRAAADRGVRVAVLLDGGPVGGITRPEARVLDALTGSNVTVAVLDGPHQRYRFHHPKYAVVDDRLLVTSENFQPSGTGGHGSRGWGAVARSQRLADRLAGVFDDDAGWRSAIPWERYRDGREFRNGSAPATATFPSRFPADRIAAERVELLLAPDNAERRLERLLAGAEQSVAVQQVRIDPATPLLNATIDAARRGVRVRILLGSAWYVADENRNLSRRLERIAAREDLDLRVRLAEPRSRYSHVHVKGVLVDGERALVGSMNWNDVSLTENREVALLVRDRRVARRFERVFTADWRGGTWRLPVGAAAGVGALLVGAALALGRLVTVRGGESG